MTAALQGMGEGPGTQGWLYLGGLGLALALLVALLALRRLERGPRFPSIKALKAETDRAIAGSDAVMFFAACRRAVQARLAARWGCAPGSITLAEMRDRGVGAPLRELFDVADAVAYSGRLVFQEEMRRWQEVVLEELARMERER